MKCFDLRHSKEEKWKCSVSQGAFAIASTVLFIRSIIDVLNSGGNTVTAMITIFASTLYLGLYFYIRLTRKFCHSVFLGLIFGLFLIQIRAEITGGLNSPVMVWFPLIPIFASFVLSRTQTWITSILSILTVLSISYAPITSIFNITLNTTMSLPSKIVLISSVILISTIICLGHEDKRRKMASKIDSQQIDLMSSAKLVELGEMAAGIAHEINNPLTVIKVKARKLERSHDMDLSEAQEIAEKIGQMSERIASIVKSMKNLSYTPNGKDIPTQSIKQLISDLNTLTESRLKYNKIDFKLKRMAVLVDHIELPVQMGQVLLNLINNASDAIKDRDLKWIRLDIDKLGDRIKFTVTDSGDGIDEEHREKLFNPFYTSKKIGKGTGLGLSISKKIVETFHGSFILNTKSTNTCFEVEIPIKDAYQGIETDEETLLSPDIEAA